jgi:ribonuclease T2
MNVLARMVIALLIVASPAMTEARKPHQQGSTPAQANQPGVFDYYVLALSWSPDYCADHANDRQQCGANSPPGFVLHGLWPQYEKGYPSSCATTPLPDDVKYEFRRLYPSPKLLDHEWSKHGTCSGLSPADYLALTRDMRGKVTIPGPYRAPSAPLRTTTGELQAAFAQANTGMPDNAVAMVCSGSGRFLQEMRICFEKTGAPRACSASVVKQMRSTCRQPSFLVRSAVK